MLTSMALQSTAWYGVVEPHSFAVTSWKANMQLFGLIGIHFIVNGNSFTALLPPVIMQVFCLFCVCCPCHLSSPVYYSSIRDVVHKQLPNRDCDAAGYRVRMAGLRYYSPCRPYSVHGSRQGDVTTLIRCLPVSRLRAEPSPGDVGCPFCLTFTRALPPNFSEVIQSRSSTSSHSGVGGNWVSDRCRAVHCLGVMGAAAVASDCSEHLPRSQNMLTDSTPRDGGMVCFTGTSRSRLKQVNLKGMTNEKPLEPLRVTMVTRSFLLT